MPEFYVYILTNKLNTTFYIGVTRDLIKRVYEHKNKLVYGFSYKYNLNKLVYFESFCNAYEAISREKQLKNWKRSWKIKLIRVNNKKMNDLSKEWF